MALNTRSILVLGATSAGWAFSFGLGSQAASHWLHAQNVTDTVIGLSHSFYYFGLAVAACLVPFLTRRLGSAACAGLGMIVSGVTLLLFPHVDGEAAWYLLRFLNGCAGALSLVPMETIVSRDSEPDRKTLNFGIYGVSLTLGGALGIGVAPHVYAHGYPATFALGAGVPMVAGAALFVGALPRAGGIVREDAATPLGWRRNFLSYGTAWSQGFLEGGMLAFLALFLESRGLSAGAAGTLMSVTMIGVILFQVPVGWLADRFGKLPLLLGCYAVVASGLLAIPWLSNSLWLAAALFAFGACTGAMYPLGLSLLSDRVPNSGLARAYAWYLAVECVGSQAGAAAMGKARDLWGETSMFAVGFVAVASVLAMWLGLCVLQRRSLIPSLSLSEPRQRQAA